MIAQRNIYEQSYPLSELGKAIPSFDSPAAKAQRTGSLAGDNPEARRTPHGYV